MRPYGIPRIDDLSKFEIREYGLASHVGVFPRGAGKHIKSLTRSSETRRQNRRFWKKRFRQEQKRELCQELNQSARSDV